MASLAGNYVPMLKRILQVASCIVLIACIGISHRNQQQDAVSNALPYYNAPDFTPQWVSAEAGRSLHRIAPFSLQNQDGRTITGDDLTGKIYVANFFFTTCGSICPRMAANLKKVAAAFADDTSVRIVSHSVLPEVDSVERLHRYAITHGINSNKWWLLTGNRDTIYRLARQAYFADEATGFNRGSNEFLHTENCVLIDRNGHIRGVYNATLELEMNKLIGHMNQLRQE
jgi:protein SCO1